MSASSVSMSALERARAARDGYWWIILIALALSVVIARMSWNAYAATSGQDRATVCIVSQALAIALAIIARRALTANMPWAAVSAGALAAGCGWWASHGLALAWYGDAERNSEIMVLFMAILEPALFLLAEHVKEGQRTYREAQAKAEDEQAAELAAIRARAAARERDEQRQRTVQSDPPARDNVVTQFRKAAGKAIKAGATGAAMLGAAQGTHAAQPAPVQHTSTERATNADGSAPRAKLGDPMRVEAWTRIQAGEKPYAVHKATGVGLTTLKRWKAAA